MKNGQVTTMPRRNGKTVATENQLLIFNVLVQILRPYAKKMMSRKPTGDTLADYEVWATRGYTGKFELKSKKKKQPGVLFAGVSIRQKNIVGLYVFPLQIDESLTQKLSGSVLEKYRHGASAFHFKELSEPLKDEIRVLLDLGLECYRKLEWV